MSFHLYLNGHTIFIPFEFMFYQFLEWFKKDRDVLDQLQPHAGLTKLTIENYGGTMFSNWLGHATFNIVSVQIHNCKYCFSLPPFGKLPSLKHLSIVGLDVEIIGTDFYGTTASRNKPFGSLETLRFKNMSQLQEWHPFTDDNGDAVAFINEGLTSPLKFQNQYLPEESEPDGCGL
jgi:hypothetical protein